MTYLIDSIESSDKEIEVVSVGRNLEIQMLAGACGKSDVRDPEPEDMAAPSLEASAICGIPLAGTRKTFGI